MENADRIFLRAVSDETQRKISSLLPRFISRLFTQLFSAEKSVHTLSKSEAVSAFAVVKLISFSSQFLSVLSIP
jgi:hypothetical protein